MSEYYEARNSIYCYEGTNVLINKLNIKDQKLLEKVERKIVLAKLYALRQNLNIGNFDIDHFVGIHKFLFEDLYEFAGKFRNENIAKGNFSFAEWEYIEPELKRILDELKEENYLEGYDKEKLANRLAYYLAEINVLHPFREGNGRTQRVFLTQLIRHSGHDINFSTIDTDELMIATIQSADGIIDYLRNLFKESIT